MFKQGIIFVLLGIIVVPASSVSYPKSLESNLKLAGKNSAELEKVIRHYSIHRADTLKRKAAIFLIENMDVHESYVSQTWDNFQSELDSLYTKEDRPSELIKGFNTLYEKYNQGLQDVVYVSDLKTISSQFLIKNIDEAFLAWKSPFAKHLNFQDFCEYILPYRIATEPLADWRTEFNKQFIPDMYSRIRKQKDSISAKDICNALKTYPYGTITFFQSDVPDYNIHTLSVMRLGSCRYYSIQAAFAGRSLGIPVALDNTPQWATRSFGHEWNAFISPDNKPMAFGIGDQVELGKHIENVPDRIPPKIYRETFAKQPSSLFFIKNEEEIPPQFDSPCYRDVTKDYYITTNVEVKPLVAAPANKKLAYLSVFDNKNWIPVAWSKKENDKFIFSDVNRGIVCLPSYYHQGGIIPAAYPVVLRKDGSVTILKPNLSKRDTITLKRKYQDRMHSWLGYAMLGGKFQVSNDSTFKDAVDIYNITVKPEQYFQTVYLTTADQYKYFRYLSPKGSYGEVSEIEVYEKDTNIKLSGKVIGNNKAESDRQHYKAFDGDILTRFKSQEADGTWVGLAFDTPKAIHRISYLPRNDGNCIDNKQLYELFYWDNKWVSLGRQTGSNETYRLIYNNVPANALLLLRNLTKGTEERVFTYENGEQVWW